ncbi:MAG: lipocalin family protein [Porphyromonas sp.]|nr:lipocalin family protein [Porphyromonas sp.]
MLDSNKTRDKDIIDVVKWGLVVGAAVVTGVTAVLYQRRSKIPHGAVPFAPFEPSKFLGKWYELARLDQRHERHLDNTTIEIEPTPDEESELLMIYVNGYNYKKDGWKQLVGLVQFREEPEVAAFDVRYSKTLSQPLNIIAVEGDYEYALAVGGKTDRCWILSRTPHIPEDVRARLIIEALRIGVEVNDLIWVNHDETEG